MKVNTYFDKEIRNRLIDSFKNAKESIEIAVTWFTDKELFATLCEMSRSGIRVEVILANNYINHESSIRYEDLRDVGGQIFFIGEPEKESPLMHLKFCIIDNSILITGSYNYTYKAHINHENIIISKEDYKSILNFHTKFTQLKHKIIHTPIAPLILNNQLLIPYAQYQKDSSIAKWGFCDENKNIIIPLSYEEIRPFAEGLSAVKKNNLWGFINQYGREVIKCEYFEVCSFREEMAAVCKPKIVGKSSSGEDFFTEGWGFINSIGKTIVECIYDKVQDFNEGYSLASIIKSETYSEEGDREYTYYHNLIDKQGNILDKNVDSGIHESFYLKTTHKKNPTPKHTEEIYKKRNKEYGFDPSDYDYYDYNLDDTYLEVVEYKNLQGFAINVLDIFNITIVNQFSNESITCKPFSEGFALVEIYNHEKSAQYEFEGYSRVLTYYFIGKNKIISQPFTGYYNVYPMKEGLIRVTIDESYNKDDFYLNKPYYDPFEEDEEERVKNEELTEIYEEEVAKNWVNVYKFGFVNIENQIVIPIDYEDAGDFSEGLARVRKQNSKKTKMGLRYSGWGFINKNNKEIIPCIYDEVYDFCEGLAVIKNDGLYGYINKLNIIVVPLIYKKAENFKDGIAKVKKDKRCYYINKKGEEFYEEVEKPLSDASSFEPIIIQLSKAIESGWEIKITEDEVLFLQNDNEQYIILDCTIQVAKQNPTIEITETNEENVYKARIVN